MNVAAFTRLTFRLRACARGAILVETALVISILAIILLGLMEWAAYIRQSMHLSNAARAGVEYAIMYPSDSEGIEQTVLDSGKIVAADLAIDVVQFCECSDGTPIGCGDICLDGTQSDAFVHVALSQPAHSLLGVSGFMPGYTATGSAILRVR